jgi:hypothetical protein
MPDRTGQAPSAPKAIEDRHPVRPAEEVPAPRPRACGSWRRSRGTGGCLLRAGNSRQERSKVGPVSCQRIAEHARAALLERGHSAVVGRGAHEGKGGADRQVTSGLDLDLPRRDRERGRVLVCVGVAGLVLAGSRRQLRPDLRKFSACNHSHGLRPLGVRRAGNECFEYGLDAVASIASSRSVQDHPRSLSQVVFEPHVWCQARSGCVLRRSTA